MGQCLKICEGTFCQKMAESTAISGQIFLILMLDRFSQRRKMRLEQAHPMQSRATPPNFSFRSYSCFKMNRLQNLCLVLLERAITSEKKWPAWNFLRCASSSGIFLRWEN